MISGMNKKSQEYFLFLDINKATPNSVAAVVCPDGNE